MHTSDLLKQGFARKITSFRYACASRGQRRDIRQAIVDRLTDTIGCARGAVQSESVAAARDLAQQFSAVAPGAVGATMLGSATRVTVEAASFVNGIAARYLDFNDIYLSTEAVHPSDNIPAALALAEGLGCTGEQVCTALIVGYETHCRLADAVSTRKGRWDNVILGAIAASVMAGSLLDLDPDQQTHAINIAAIGNTALMETRVGTLSMWKAAAAAYAARAGVFAALAASHGITAPELALDGTHGLFAQVTGVAAEKHFSEDLDHFQLLDTHLKAFPSQYFTQTAVSAALELRSMIGAGKVSGIRKIAVSTFEFGRIAAADGPDKWRPQTRETADHSMPYCVAIALLDGELTTEKFDAKCLRRDDVRNLLGRITVEERGELTAMYPTKVPARIKIELEDGSHHEILHEFPLGHSRNPMSKAQMDAKFASLSGHDARSEALLAGLYRIEELDAQATTALLRQAASV